LISSSGGDSNHNNPVPSKHVTRMMHIAGGYDHVNFEKRNWAEIEQHLQKVQAKKTAAVR
jgi:hypothetical protein